MAASSALLPPNNKSGFRAPSRHISTHDDKGISKFVPEHIVPVNAPWQDFGPNFSSLLWATMTSPAQMTDEADLKAYTSGMVKPSEIVTKNGTNMRLFDFAPGFQSEMHRTDSIDYSIVILGTIESQVDGGEVRVGKPGDVFIQRGTNHQWRNPSKTEWTRMCFFVVAADQLVVAGEELEAITSVDSALNEE
jgi:quercetin dioxygenase-like cupin family protein